MSRIKGYQLIGIHLISRIDGSNGPADTQFPKYCFFLFLLWCIALNERGYQEKNICLFLN